MISHGVQMEDLSSKLYIKVQKCRHRLTMETETITEE